MARDDAYQAEGRVVEALGPGTYRVELPNGHRLIGFVAGKSRRTHAPLAPGCTVRLDLSPCDLSAGRIVLNMKSEPV